MFLKSFSLYSLIYTYITHNLIKEKLIKLIEKTFNKGGGSLYLACDEIFFISEQHKRYNLWSCQKVCDALLYLLDNIL